MDYSLLVGIHDCSIPSDMMDEFNDIDDDYDSTEEYSDVPLSPTNTGKLYIYSYVCTFIHLM